MKFRITIVGYLAPIVITTALVLKIFSVGGVDIDNAKDIINAADTYSSALDFYFIKEWLSWVIIYIANLIPGNAIALFVFLAMIGTALVIGGLRMATAIAAITLSVPGVLLSENVIRQWIAVVFLMLILNQYIEKNKLSITLMLAALFSHNSVILVPIFIVAYRWLLRCENIFLALAGAIIITLLIYNVGQMEFIALIFQNKVVIESDSIVEVYAFFLNFAILYSAWLLSTKVRLLNGILVIIIHAVLVHTLAQLVPYWLVNRLQLYSYAIIFIMLVMQMERRQMGAFVISKSLSVMTAFILFFSQVGQLFFHSGARAMLGF
jgi:hypothetical protein